MMMKHWEYEFCKFCNEYKTLDRKLAFEKLMEFIADEENTTRIFRVHFYPNPDNGDWDDTFTTMSADDVVGLLFEKVELYNWRVMDVCFMRTASTPITTKTVIWLYETKARC